MPYDTRRRRARPHRGRAPAARRKKALRCGAALVAAACACAGAMSLAWPAKGALTDDEESLDAASPFWVEPRGPAARQVEVWRERGREDDARVLQRIAREPVAVWLTGDDPKAQAANVTRQAERAGVIPVLVAYNIPQRDCGQYSSGGAPDAAHYRTWASRAAAGIGARRAWIVLEPDALAQWASGCVPAAAAKQRTALIAQAVRTFKARPGVSVYIDAGNPGWIKDQNLMVTALTEAGIAEADGFALNVSNFHTTPVTRAYGDHLSALLGGAHYVIDTSRNGNGPLPEPPHKDKGKKKDDRPKGGLPKKRPPKGRPHAPAAAAEARRAAGRGDPEEPEELEVLQELEDLDEAAEAEAGGTERDEDEQEPEGEAEHRPEHEDVHEAEPQHEQEGEHEPESWCNPPGRALGAPPTTATGDPRVDAFLWVKRPGESDGACRGAPPAGRWWAEYALELARATPGRLTRPSLEPGEPEVPIPPPAAPPGTAPGLPPAGDASAPPAASGPATAPAPAAPAPVPPAPVPAPPTIAPPSGPGGGPGSGPAPAAPPAGLPVDPPDGRPVKPDRG
ncbi:glycoside hydrolase family 6 protein [Streptomyces roseoverticillatus]|nr:glycoside hydrolase family 6 protein [Streptomyces roseoverticillatus]